MRDRSLCLLLAAGLVGASLGDKTPDTAPAEGRPSMAASLAAAVKERVGVSVVVDVVEPGAIERSQGKARRIVDLRPGNA